MSPTVMANTSGSGIFEIENELGLERLVSSLGSENEFVIVQRDDRDGQYAQACVTPRKLYRKGLFTVEFREGPQSHWQGFCNDPVRVLRVLAGWAYDKPGWRDTLEWSRLDL